jgi:hypothetical protein
MIWLGKLLFPRSQRHEQGRKLRALTAAVIVGLLIAAALGLGFYWFNARGHH